MANTTSWKFPDMFNVTQNTVNVITDEASVANRTRLLALTDPTELYNEPNFGVGLRKFIWQYNTENTRAIIKDRIKEQVLLHEPCVDTDKMTFEDGLLGSDPNEIQSALNGDKLEMSITLPTKFGGTVNLPLDDEMQIWVSSEEHTDTDELALR